MHIVYSSDDNYAQHMGASVYSLLSHNAGSAIVIYVIDNGISSDSKGKLQQIINQFPLSRPMAVYLLEVCFLRMFPAACIWTVT